MQRGQPSPAQIRPKQNLGKHIALMNNDIFFIAIYAKSIKANHFLVWWVADHLPPRINRTESWYFLTHDSNDRRRFTDAAVLGLGDLFFKAFETLVKAVWLSPVIEAYHEGSVNLFA